MSAIIKMNLVWFKGSDGLDIPGHLSLAQVDRPAPAVLMLSGGIHGSVYGNDGEYDPLHVAIVDHLNKNGFSTFIVDKRGSKGYGEGYQSLLDMCGEEVNDVIAGSEYLNGLEHVIDGGLAIHGTSRSATTAALALTRTDDFNAAILASGFYNLKKQYEYERKFRSDIFPSRQSIQGKEIYEIPHWQRSPINFVNKVSCPVLLVHGLDDTIVLPENSVDFLHSLRASGKDAEMISYDKFAHLKSYSYPSHSVGKIYWESCINFLNKKLRHGGKNNDNEG